MTKILLNKPVSLTCFPLAFLEEYVCKVLLLFFIKKNPEYLKIGIIQYPFIQRMHRLQQLPSGSTTLYIDESHPYHVL